MLRGILAKLRQVGRVLMGHVGRCGPIEQKDVFPRSVTMMITLTYKPRAETCEKFSFGQCGQNVPNSLLLLSRFQ